MTTNCNCPASVFRQTLLDELKKLHHNWDDASWEGIPADHARDMADWISAVLDIAGQAIAEEGE